MQLGLLVSAHAASDKPSAGGVTTVGTTRPLDIVRGSGTDVPLAQALAAIVPRDFTIRTTAVSPTMLNQPASWTGGRPWTDALLDMLEPYPELVVDVSLGARLVIVRQVPLSPMADSAREAVIPSMQQGMPNNARPTTYAPPQTQPLSRSAREPAVSVAPRAPAATMPATMPANASFASSAFTPAPAAAPAGAQAATQAAIQAAAQAAIQSATQAAIQSAIQAATQAATQAAQAAQAAEKEAAKAVTWDIRSTDKTIRSALARWAASAGWQLSWELSVDYPVYAQASFPGQFENAVESVVKSLEHTEVPVRAVFYRGNHVLRLIAKGVQ
ncbi:hypothetical protein D3871_26105 [Noviherbaspirillum saxi]|uniref:Toxin co-regulated pilus biosynthesis protein Q C-terminal domain-containing protein n=2 Tax=Noviherbaspirillum saxi TaxID=2320863 RepID=A0A3A3FG13_9BURK|nr:hypothetical protein D3871_26105 [Noviherbaspirillum saxi]